MNHAGKQGRKQARMNRAKSWEENKNHAINKKIKNTNKHLKWPLWQQRIKSHDASAHILRSNCFS